MSMKPGATTKPEQSTTSRASVSAKASTLTIRSPESPTSARYAGCPLPSMTVPFVRRRSRAITNPPVDCPQIRTSDGHATTNRGATTLFEGTASRAISGHSCMALLSGPKVWPTLFEERVRPLEHVERSDGLCQHPEAAEKGVVTLVKPDIGCDLCNLEVARAHFQQLLRPSNDFLMQLLGRNDRVDPAPLEGLLCRIAPT